MAKIIYGIQQIGVGVADAWEGFRWYGKHLGSDVKVFDDENVATYMAPYMGGNPHKKHAILAANMKGGSCYEIWQFSDRTPEAPKSLPELGDLGIFAAKVKTHDINFAHKHLTDLGVNPTEIQKDPNGNPHFFIQDLHGNVLQIVEATDWFNNSKKKATGGNCGCILGVSDIEKSRKLYSDVLGYDKVLYDKTDVFEDLQLLKNGKSRFRRVLLTHSEERRGSLSALLGRSQIELVQDLEKSHPRIYEGRFWGDIGFIHLCFDIHGMADLKADCAAAGFPFTVESNPGFQMGDAAGHWSYLEDPDGTLIEFVETKKIPLIKKWNWYLNLEKRDPHKPLPRLLIKAIGLNRVKMK